MIPWVFGLWTICTDKTRPSWIRWMHISNSGLTSIWEEEGSVGHRRAEIVLMDSRVIRGCAAGTRRIQIPTDGDRQIVAVQILVKHNATPIY